MPRSLPEVLIVDSKQLRDVKDRAQRALDAGDADLVGKVFDSYEYLARLIGQKNMSIQKLQALMFGAKTEKTAQVVKPGSSTPEPTDADASQPADTNESDSDEAAANTGDKPPPPGHGRRGADAYRGAQRVAVPHASLSAGDSCPECGRGTVYEKPPAVVVRITGQPPLGATRYELQKLRCHLCGQVFIAELPASAGAQKYDAQAAVMIGLLKYGSGLPFHRLEGLQADLDIPLPASTQWDVLADYAPRLQLAFDELIRQAAFGDVLYNDDTTVKILTLMGPRRAEIDSDSSRTGVFTSGIVATRDARRIALFFSGHQHAGENLADVLRHRAAELETPIQMCDALSRNLPAELEVILANCLAHARRKFVEIYAHFPDACRTVLEAFGVVYRTDALARQQSLTPAERLQFHQTHSQTPMTTLKNWLQRQWDEKLVEPNSALGAAIKYLQRHWEKLTRFLNVAGAPLDNNVCERALKKAILRRKNSLFYRTQAGARMGDVFMSLIHTCELNQANPFDYLTALVHHADQVATDPAHWLPWNYRQSLAGLPSAT